MRVQTRSVRCVGLCGIAWTIEPAKVNTIKLEAYADTLQQQDRWLHRQSTHSVVGAFNPVMLTKPSCRDQTQGQGQDLGFQSEGQKIWP